MPNHIHFILCARCLFHAVSQKPSNDARCHQMPQFASKSYNFSQGGTPMPPPPLCEGVYPPSCTLPPRNGPFGPVPLHLTKLLGGTLVAYCQKCQEVEKNEVMANQGTSASFRHMSSMGFFISRAISRSNLLCSCNTRQNVRDFSHYVAICLHGNLLN